MRFPKIRLRYLVPVVLAILFLTAGIPSILQPLVYEKTPPRFMTRFHLDPTLYRESTRNASESSLSVMQELVDSSGPIVLSIRVSDPESAMRDLQKYRNEIRDMDQLVVTFDMSESDLQQYLQSHRNNAKILDDLLNETSRYDQLERLEVQLVDSEDPGQFTSVIYEKEAIRKRVNELYNDYEGNSATIESTANKYQLDTTGYEVSKGSFNGIVEDLGADANQAEQDLRSSQKENNFLSLFIEPGIVHYGETLKGWGILREQRGQDLQVRIYFDGLQAGIALPDGDGRYEFLYPIERLKTGLHSVYAQHEAIQSLVNTVTLEETGSKITLVTEPPVPGAVTCTGTLTTTGGKPVKQATIDLIWDSTHVLTAQTDDKGTYKERIAVPSGRHALKARFSAEGFPLKPSESAPKNVVIPPGANEQFASILSVLVAGGVIAASGAGAVLYLRRKGVHYRSEVEREEPVSDLVAEPTGPGLRSLEKRTTSLIELFLRLIGLTGLREAAFAVYRRFTMRVEGLLGLARIRSLTPRELAVRSAGLPFHAALQDFIPRYELLRYGPDPDSGREAFESVIGPLDIATRKGENIRDLTRGESGEQEGGILTGNEIDQNPPGERKTPSDESASGHEGSQSGVIEWR